MWNSKSRNKNELRIMFSFHHALVDGMYMAQLFADFIEFLDLVHRQLLSSNDVKEVQLWPAIEDLVSLNAATTKRNVLERIVCADCTAAYDQSVEALDAYEHSFQSEILLLSSAQEKDFNEPFENPFSVVKVIFVRMQTSENDSNGRCSCGCQPSFRNSSKTASVRRCPGFGRSC